MNENSVEQQNAVRKYLLGNLRDTVEMRLIEEKILLDEGFAEQLSIREDELIEDYLDETLTEPEREQFLRFFLASPENREKLRFIQNLRKYAASHTDAQDVRQFSKENAGWFDWRKLFSSPALRFATIVLLLFGVGFGIWRIAFYQSDVDRGLAELRTAFRGKRPVESRTTAGFDYAPLLITRGSDTTPVTADEKAQKRAEYLLSEAAKNPSDVRAQQALGLLYLADKKYDRALDEFNLALKLAPNNPKIHNDLGAAFLEKAKQAEADKKFDEAAENYPLALKSFNQALEIDNSFLEALYNKALVLQKMQVTNQAREAWEKYLEKDSASPWAEEARKNLQTLNERSGAQKDESRILQDFLVAFQKRDDARGWEIASQTKELITGAMLAPHLARKFLEAREDSREKEADEILSAFVYLGELERRNAKDLYFSELADYYSKTNQTQRRRLLQASAAMRNGYESLLKSNWQEALKIFRQAKSDFSAAGNNWEAQIAEYQICYCLCQTNKIKESNERLLTLADSSKEKNYKWMQTLADGWIGSNYNLLGEHSKAIAHDRKSLQTAEEISDTYNLQKSFNQLTNEYWLISDKQKTLSSVYQNLNVENSYYQSPRQKGRNLLFAAESFYRFRFYDAAIAFAREEIDFAQNELKSLGARHAAHNHLAIILGEAKKYSEAFQQIEASFQAADSFPDETAKQKQTAKTRLILAHLQRAANNCQEAIENYNEVIHYYQDTEFAVNNYEAQKGRLLCYAAQKDDSAVSREIPELIESFDGYRRKLKEPDRNNFFNTEQEVYDIAADYAFARLGDAEQAFDYTENSRARSLLNLVDADSPQPLVLSELRQKIPPDVQMIYYAVLADRLVIWQISGTKFVAAEKSVKANELDDKIQNYAKLLTDPNKDSRNAAKELYELLIEPIKPTLEANKTLCIVADKALFRVSFASLVAPQTGKYLIEDYALLYAPSATIFVNETEIARRKATNPGETILSVGNPSFSREEYPELDDLPDAAREAKEVAAFYDAPKIFLEKQAAKQPIADRLNEADVLHFAGHYVPNLKSPSLSKLLLAAGDLTVEEIMQTKLPRVRLMILSACDTGVEKFYNGEGMIGAARAFLASDVPLMVASHWAVDSTATAELMIKFHRNRKQQRISTIAALRQAQIEMLHGENRYFRQPFYWAGFLPIGGYADY